MDQFLRVAAQNQISIEEEEEEVSEVSADTEESKESRPNYQWKYEFPTNHPISEPYERDRHNILLFQQYYRFFPLIPVLIELAKVTGSTGEPVELSEFRDHVEEKVIPIRNKIMDWEDKNSIKKQNKKSTGFPKRDVKNTEYSMKRYLDHFVGKVRKRDNEPQSFGDSLALVSYNPLDSGQCLLQLTRAGKELINIQNPILKDGPENPPLSREEREYLLQHISEVLPEEFKFMSFVYDTLKENEAETYTNSLDQFREFLMNSDGFDDEDPSDDRIRSITAGVLSRMVELGIVVRGDKRGVYVPEREPRDYIHSESAGD